MRSVNKTVKRLVFAVVGTVDTLSLVNCKTEIFRNELASGYIVCI